MTELSALAGSAGYAACDDEASVELAAFGGQPRRRVQRRSPSAALAAGGLYCKKGRRGLFYSHIVMTPAGAGVIYCHLIKNLAEFRALWARKGLGSFSAAACTSPKILLAKRASNCPPLADNRGAKRSAGPHRPLAAGGGVIVKEGRRGPFLTVSSVSRPAGRLTLCPTVTMSLNSGRKRV